jgi:hypothetical protein
MPCNEIYAQNIKQIDLEKRVEYTICPIKFELSKTSDSGYFSFVITNNSDSAIQFHQFPREDWIHFYNDYFSYNLFDNFEIVTEMQAMIDSIYKTIDVWDLYPFRIFDQYPSYSYYYSCINDKLHIDLSDSISTVALLMNIFHKDSINYSKIITLKPKESYSFNVLLLPLLKNMETGKRKMRIYFKVLMGDKPKIVLSNWSYFNVIE